MFLLKIKDLFQIESFYGSNLIAGKNAGDSEIKSISVLEVTGEKIKDWVLEDQLYITSFYAIIQNIEEQKSVIRTLSLNGASGIVICHLDMFLKEINEEVIELCDTLNFPLIVVDSNKSYVEILNPVLLRLNDSKTSDFYRNHIKMQDHLIRYISSRGDLNYIYQTMANQYGRKIYFLNINQQIIFPTYKEIDADFQRAIDRQIHSTTENETTKISSFDFHSADFIIYPIVSNDVKYGTIIAETNKDINDSINILESISSICTLIFTQSERLHEQEKLKKQEFISDLVTWNFRNDDVVISRGLEIGWNIADMNRLVIVNLNDIQAGGSSDFSKFESFIENVLYKGIEYIIKKYTSQYAAGSRSDIIFILIEGIEFKNHQTVKEMGKDILNYCLETFKGSVSIGSSSYFESFKYIPEAYHEAMDAAKLGRYFIGENKSTTYEDLGFYGALREIYNLNKYRKIKQHLGHQLINFDKENNSDLYNTLKFLIYNNMNAELTAEKLFVHKNTINYRKKKIVDILGYKPWEMPHLMNFILLFASEYFD